MNLAVGQEVWVYDVNSRGRGPDLGTVEKVGRKLVTVRYDGMVRKFRIEDRHTNDAYGHQWIQTDEERALADRRDVAISALRVAGLEIRSGGYSLGLSTETLEALVAVLEAKSLSV